MEIAHIVLTIVKTTAAFQWKIPRTGNDRKHKNVGSKYWHDAISYKITLTININSEVSELPVTEKTAFFLWKVVNIGSTLEDLWT